MFLLQRLYELDHFDDSVVQTQLVTILHYATSGMIPHQSLAEIKVSFDVLQSLAPCNFWVYGLDHDSVMWSSFNPKGIAPFLKEHPKWVQIVLKQAPNLLAYTAALPSSLAVTIAAISQNHQHRY